MYRLQYCTWCQCAPASAQCRGSVATWRGAQCTNRRSRQSEFCAQYKKLPVLKEGRYDCELTEEDALAYACKAASYVRPFVCRFYSRTKMWDEAQALGLDAVDAVDEVDEQVARRPWHLPCCRSRTPESSGVRV